MFVIAGPCAIESRDLVFEVAKVVKGICDELGLSLFFKSSFDKANRTSLNARGVGMEQGLDILSEVKERFNVPILTDIHETWQCDPVAQVADVLQIPAFLSRQTDLIQKAVMTGKTVNIKKGQFMAPWDMKGVIQKANAVAPNPQLWLTERGSSFGYGRLVVDMSGIVLMRQYGYPVVFDATHSVQRPSSDGHTGGDNQLIRPLLRAAIATGIDGIFIETHPNPSEAISDSNCQLPLSQFEDVLKEALLFYKTFKQTLIKDYGKSGLST